ncbi:MAG: FAD/NAD(P)-binding protein, partial [Rhodospirillaceae bacterium]|nr:FAD/NAD(P)-binding protein [Rhodospirillaceae bacterium]
MVATKKNRIAIIGAGFSGSLLAVQLLRRFLPRAQIHLIEKDAQFGRGLAYSTGNPGHLLNVRASRMSAFADEPDHFLRWLAREADAGRIDRHLPVGPESFVPRRLYGTYIQDLLGNEIWKTGRGKSLHLVPDEALAIRPRGDGIAVELASGRHLAVDIAVLATGNVPQQEGASDRFANPWNPAALAGLDRDAPVLLAGTGLTMVDTAISLAEQGHRGTIHAVSRRGLLPRSHGAAPPLPGIDPFAVSPFGVVGLLRAVRGAVREAAKTRGMPAAWRSVVDALRPHTGAIWRALSDVEKRRFLRHLRPWWDVHRHRMAPEVATRIAEMLGRRQLQVSAARIERIERAPAGLAVVLRRRGAEARETLRVARFIDCTGPQCDYARIADPLIRNLLEQGAARPDSLHLGLDVAEDAALIDRWGVPSPRLYALGP